MMEIQIPDEAGLLSRITTDPEKFGGKPIIRGHRLAVEHVLRYLAAGVTPDELREDFSWLDAKDIQACMLFALRAYQTASGERVEMINLERAS